MLFNKTIAMKLYDQFNISKFMYTKMYNYYIGNTDTKNSYPKTDRSNRVANTNYIKKFITEHVSYAVGNPITYISRSNNNNMVQDIEYHMVNQIGSLDAELMKNMLIFGESYEIYYLNQGEFKVRVCSPLNSIPYCDIEGNVQLFMYFYKRELDDNKVYIDVYDDKFIYHFDDAFNQIAPPTPHYFGIVPVGVARLGNGTNETLFNDIGNLQDNYENVVSDWLNMSGDLRDAYLLFSGATLDDEIAENIKSKGIIQMPDGGEAKFLTKNIQADFIRSLADTIEDKIYQISQSVNNNEAMQSNTSGVALQSRIISLRNRIGLEQKALSDCIKTRLKCLFMFLYQSESKVYDYKDVKIQFTMNIPQDDVSMAQVISQLSGKLSIQTGLSQLSFITDAKGELDKMIEEQKLLTPEPKEPKANLQSAQIIEPNPNMMMMDSDIKE